MGVKSMCGCGTCALDSGHTSTPLTPRSGSHLMRLVNRSLIAALVTVTFGSVVYLHGYVDSGHKWGTSSVPYFVNPQSATVSANAVISAVQTGAAAWHDQTR